MSDTTNPGLVNVSDQAYPPSTVNQAITTGPSNSSGPLIGISSQGDGLVVVEQPITVTPSTSSGPLVQASSRVQGLGSSATVPTTRSTSMTPGPNVNADLPSPLSVHVTTTQQNTVIGQIYGQGSPQNVFV